MDLDQFAVKEHLNNIPYVHDGLRFIQERFNELDPPTEEQIRTLKSAVRWEYYFLIQGGLEKTTSGHVTLSGFDTAVRFDPNEAYLKLIGLAFHAQEYGASTFAGLYRSFEDWVKSINMVSKILPIPEDKEG